MEKKIVTCSLFFVLIFFSSLPLLAADETGKSVTPQPRPVTESSEWKPHVGIIMGAAYPEGNGGASGEFGLDIGYQPYIPYGLGAQYTHSRVDVGDGTQDRDTLWVKGTYNFGGDIAILKESYVGLGLGAVFSSDETAAAVAPLIGFDLPVGNKAAAHELGKDFFTLGASARYAVISNGDVDTFSLNAIVKYWY